MTVFQSLWHSGVGLEKQLKNTTYGKLSTLYVFRDLKWDSILFQIGIKLEASANEMLCVMTFECIIYGKLLPGYLSLKINEI